MAQTVFRPHPNPYAFDAEKIPGTWALYSETAEGEWWKGRHPETVITRCPLCSWAGLTRRHTIHPDGRMTASYVCVNKECTYHEWVTLEGWTHGLMLPSI